jgi:transcriptional regulator with XRE-family HTH domain
MKLRLPEILKALMKRDALNESALARKTGIRQPVINRILSGKTPNPQISTLIPLAKHFNVSLESLTGVITCDMPKEKPPEKKHRIPYLTREEILTWCRRTDAQIKTQQPASKTSIKSFINPSDLGFAFSVFDETMSPCLPKSAMVIINPTLAAEHGDFILVACKKTKQILFKQYLLDGKLGYLKSSNPDFPTIPMKKNMDILGVMVQALIGRNQEVCD